MVSTSTEPKYFSVEEVAAHFAVAIPTVYRWITQGVLIGGAVVRLAAFRIGGIQRISQENIDDFVRACNPEEWRQVALRQEKERREAKKDRKRLHEKLDRK